MEPPHFLAKIFRIFWDFWGHFFKIFGACGALFCVFERLRRNFSHFFWTRVAPPSHCPVHPDGMLIFFQRSFMALVLPMVLVKIERTGIKQTGHNLLHSTQVRLNQSSLVATFPSASFLLCLICAVFSSAAPAALHFTTIFP